MTNAVLAIGTLLQIQDPIALTWATISEVRSIAGLDLTTVEKEVTNHSSPGRTKEYLGTLNDPGQVQFEVNYNPADPTHDENTGLLYHKLNFTRPVTRIVLPDTGHKTLTFPTFVREFKMQEKVDDVLIASCVMRAISAPTFSGT